MKLLAYEWMSGYGAGASHGTIPNKHPKVEFNQAWQEGYDAGKRDREKAREECERKYGITFATITTCKSCKPR